MLNFLVLKNILTQSLKRFKDSLNFFLDENFPKRAIGLLEKLGHLVFDVRGTEQEGLKDNALFDIAQEHQAIFLTTDRDFFHTVPYLFPKHHGVIVIALSQPNGKIIMEKLNWALDFMDANPIEMSVLLLKDKSYYIKKAISG